MRMGAQETDAREPIRVGTLTVLMCAMATGCAGEDEREVLPPVVVALPDTVPPVYDNGQQQIFQVGREVRLPYRRPTDQRQRGAQDPYPHEPFHIARETRVTLRYTLSNLDDRQHTVELLIAPWNEFVRYVPGVSTGRDGEVLLNLSGIDRTVVLPPKGRVSGSITPDDVVELAVDLTVAMALARRPPDPTTAFGGPALYNRTFDVQNRSSEPDPVLQEWMPASRANVAAVIGFDVGLRTYEPANVAVELSVDIEDLNGERVVMDGEEGRQVDRPGSVLSPPLADGARM